MVPLELIVFLIIELVTNLIPLVIFVVAVLLEELVLSTTSAAPIFIYLPPILTS